MMEMKRRASLLAYLFLVAANLAAVTTQARRLFAEESDEAAPLPPPSVNRSSFPVSNMTAFGAAGSSRPLVWYDDPDFRQELIPKSPLQLVDQQKPPCSAKCEACDYAWKATRDGLQVALFFRDPVHITKIHIKQVKNSGVVAIQTLKWIYPPSADVGPLRIGRTVWNVTDDSSICQSVFTVHLTPKQSGISKPVPAAGSREALPPQLASTATGGVLITVKQAGNAGDRYGPFLEFVRFSGRVLYAQDASIYPAKVKKASDE